ncbi:MAG: hypothetical protein AAF253_10610 [Pseudomonadota bacterium]
MRLAPFAATIALIAGAAGCQLTPQTSVADYCANPTNAETHVCQLSMDVDGTRTALAETDMSLTQASEIADRSLRAAAQAQRTADGAQATADEALRRANAALAEDDLFCETRVINNSDVGTCAEGFTVMSCSQTRYTTRAGGLSFLREIDNEQCRFNARVLEMHVRCCAAATSASTTAMLSLPGATR